MGEWYWDWFFSPEDRLGCHEKDFFFRVIPGLDEVIEDSAADLVQCGECNLPLIK